MQDKKEKKNIDPVLMEIGKLNRRFDELKSNVDGRFDALTGEIAGLNNRFDELNGKVDGLTDRFDAHEKSTEKYFGAVNLEFVAVRGEMNNGFEAVREEMRRGFAMVAAKGDVISRHVEETLERVKRLEEDNGRAHSLDLHKRVRRIEKHLFEKAG